MRAPALSRTVELLLIVSAYALPMAVLPGVIQDGAGLPKVAVLTLATALLFGAGVPAGQVVDRRVDQISVTSTLGELMKCPTTLAEGRVLEEAIA